MEIQYNNNSLYIKLGTLSLIPVVLDKLSQIT